MLTLQVLGNWHSTKSYNSAFSEQDLVILILIVVSIINPTQNDKSKSKQVHDIFSLTHKFKAQNQILTTVHVCASCDILPIY